METREKLGNTGTLARPLPFLFSKGGRGSPSRAFGAAQTPKSTMPGRPENRHLAIHLKNNGMHTNENQPTPPSPLRGKLRRLLSSPARAMDLFDDVVCTPAKKEVWEAISTGVCRLLAQGGPPTGVPSVCSMFRPHTVGATVKVSRKS